MERLLQLEYMGSCSSTSFTENNDTINNNAVMTSNGNHVMDLKSLSSRIICSDNITRKNLNKRPSISNPTLTTDDDEQFFIKMKSEIDKNLLLGSKENEKPRINYQSSNLTVRKKRPIIDMETQNVIKRFKRDSDQINFIQSLNNMTIMQRNNVNNISNKMNNSTMTSNEGNIMPYKSLLSSNSLNRRIPPNKYLFQATSKLQQNVLPTTVEEETIFHEKYEESLYYGMMLLTPPNSNSVENDDDES